MNKVTVITHFSQPNWPVVNKLSAINKCLDVNMIHCSALDKLHATLAKNTADRILFFTDEGLIETVQELENKCKGIHLEVAMFIGSPISSVAQKIADLSIVKYLIGAEPAESYGRDLSILIKKFSDQDILDLGKYLAFGSKIHEMIVNSEKTKKLSLEAVGHYISRLGDPGYSHPFDEYARRVCELTDELLLNAVFDANPRLRGVDRGLPFQLTPQENIQISWGYDGEYFGVAVRDPFGKFTCDTIMKYLSAQKEMEDIISAPSAGLGLKFIFEKAHQVVTNVRKEKVTEVIALLKFGSRLLEFERQKKSFYFFDDRTADKKKNVTN
jgi:hypothetical protein